MATKAIKMFFALSLLYNLGHAFHFASYTIFLQDRGMDFVQMGMVNLFFMFISAFLEMPTGAFADKFGRKKTVIISCLISSIATLTYFYSTTFWQFVLAESIGAIALTLYNGAMQAWLYDSLEHFSYEGDICEIQRKENQLGLIGKIIGSIIGGYIGAHNIAYPWLASCGGTLVVAFFCVMFCKEEYRDHKDFRPHEASVFKIAWNTLQHGIQNKHLLYIGLFEFFLISTFQGFNMQWTILFKDSYNLGLIELGWIMGAVLAILFVGSKISRSVSLHYGNSSKAIIGSQIITAIFMILTAFSSSVSFTLIWFFIHELGRGMFEPLRTMYVNRHGQKNVRATIHSFNGMMNKFGASVGLLLTGIVAQTYSVKTCWLMSGCVLAIVIISFIKFKPDEN